ncbi:MAG: hypothetical protein KC505_10030 [Myxococcales bacterium]|nr:hypothetical protein [Myxococcales bacterium]USN49857.1 MAG: hypothetical protein H6731_06140 [Myxococcales bacterium]
MNSQPLSFILCLIFLFLNFYSATITGQHNSEPKRNISSSADNKEDEKFLKSFSSIMNGLEKQHVNYEIKRVKKLFGQMDNLFSHMQIKYQFIDEENNLGQEYFTTLYHFLSGPFELDEIISILKNELFIDFTNTIKKKFHDELSLANVLRFLWKKNKISVEKSQAILAQNAQLTSREVIKLVENGAVRSTRGMLVKLSTGETYGDPLTLFNRIEMVLNNYKTYSKSNELDTIDFPLDKHLVREFEKLEMNANKAILDGKIIHQLRKHFLFINNLGLFVRFRSQTAAFNYSLSGGMAAVNPLNSFSSTVTPQSLSAMLVGNHYFAAYNSSITNSLFVNPMGLSFSGSYNWMNNLLSGRSLDWWVYYTDSYLGFGANYTMNFEQGTFWSNGQVSFLSFGGVIAGWKNYLQAGIALQTLLANSIGAGGNVIFNISREHSVAYLGRYPIDGKFSSLRDKHKIEVKDNRSIGISASAAFNFWATNVPISIAFRAGTEHTIENLFRTHVDLEQAQNMLSESDIAGLLLILGKKISHSKFPGFENPDELQEGDELVQKKIGKLFGAFVTGIEAFVPIAPFRIGGNIELAAEFEMGLNRLPNNKFQVSVEPTRVFEIGLFNSVMNVIANGAVHGISLARKQIFLFDFNNPEAKEAYFNMVHNGELPNRYEMEISSEERGAENLLMDFRAQNNALKTKGIELTYLEQTHISSNSVQVGFYAPIVPAIISIINKADKITRPNKDRINISFEGVDREVMRADGTSIATNGLIAVRRSSYGGRVSEGQGFSGRFNKDLYITHRRIYSIDEHMDNASISNFDSLLIHAQLEDTKITGNEENRIVEHINKLFSTQIDSFVEKNSKFPRLINIERELSRRDLFILSSMSEVEKIDELIQKAHRASGIDKYRLETLLKELKNKHPDKQGLIIKQFIETADGYSGFSAIHHLLGAQPEDLFVHTESGYMEIVNQVRTFIANFSSHESNSQLDKVIFNAENNKKNRKLIKEFYKQTRIHLRHIDRQLRLLQSDKYLLDESSPLAKKIGLLRYRGIIENGIRQDKSLYGTALVSARNDLLRLLDLKQQGFSDIERQNIYTIAKKKRLRIEDDADNLFIKYHSHQINFQMSKDEIIERVSEYYDLLELLNTRITALQQDEVMKQMDPEYVKNYIERLEHYKNILNEVNSLQDKSIPILQEKFKSRPHALNRLFRSKKRQTKYRIQGTLDALNHQEQTRQSIVHQDDKKNLAHDRRTQSLLHIGRLN